MKQKVLDNQIMRVQINNIENMICEQMEKLDEIADNVSSSEKRQQQSIVIKEFSNGLKILSLSIFLYGICRAFRSTK